MERQKLALETKKMSKLAAQQEVGSSAPIVQHSAMAEAAPNNYRPV